MHMHVHVHVHTHAHTHDAHAHTCTHALRARHAPPHAARHAPPMLHARRRGAVALRPRALRRTAARAAPLLPCRLVHVRCCPRPAPRTAATLCIPAATLCIPAAALCVQAAAKYPRCMLPAVLTPAHVAVRKTEAYRQVRVGLGLGFG